MNNNKLRILAYSKNYPKIFNKKKKELVKVLDNVEIHHIGSTAIPGLGGKGFIDILIGLDDWKQKKEIIDKLKSICFTHIHPEDNQRIFICKDKKTEEFDIHLHLVVKNSQPYKDILFFRDYLREHPDEANKYFDLKQQLLQNTNTNRQQYTKLKKDYIDKITNLRHQALDSFD